MKLNSQALMTLNEYEYNWQSFCNGYRRDAELYYASPQQVDMNKILEYLSHQQERPFIRRKTLRGRLVQDGVPCV